MKTAFSEYGMAVFYAVFGGGYMSLMAWFLTELTKIL